MKKIIILIVAFWSISISAQNISTDNLTKHVYVLASDSLEGRKAGTEGGQKAAHYIINELDGYGIAAETDTSMSDDGVALVNVHHTFEGSDDKLKDEFIVIVSHYDHIGINSDNQLCPGANDNATSVAALLEMARQWKQTKRSVIFLWSDGEEIGVLGTKSFTNKHADMIDKIKLAISSEMLGYYSTSGRFECLGKSTTVEGAEIIKSIDTEGLNCVTTNFMESVFLGSTDTLPFQKLGIPVMVWMTPSMDNYHTPTDTADEIDYASMTGVTKHLYKAIQAFANNETITASEAAHKEIKK